MALKAATKSRRHGGRDGRRSPPPRLPEEQATLIQVCPKVDGVMNHTYRDYSRIPMAPTYVPPTTIDDMTFSQKVHAILSNPTFERCISWMPHGRAFKVHCPLEFERDVSPVYFGHGRYSSFLRSLDNYGFKHISKGTDRNCYYHELVLRGNPHLCQYMPRCRDARRLAADPSREPNFYAINEVYGAPDDHATAQEQQVRAVSPASTSSTTCSDNAAAKLLASLATSSTTSHHPSFSSPAPSPQKVVVAPPVTHNKNNSQDDLARVLLGALLVQQYTVPGNTTTQTTAPSMQQEQQDPASVLARFMTPPLPPPQQPVVKSQEDLVTGVLLGALLLQCATQQRN